jgi:cytochrome P450
MIVGYQTTANSLAFTAYCLATNLECQEKLIMEIDSIIGQVSGYPYELLFSFSSFFFSSGIS